LIVLCLKLYDVIATNIEGNICQKNKHICSIVKSLSGGAWMALLGPTAYVWLFLIEDYVTKLNTTQFSNFFQIHVRIEVSALNCKCFIYAKQMLNTTSYPL
jgi:hypothetical protein